MTAGCRISQPEEYVVFQDSTSSHATGHFFVSWGLFILHFGESNFISYGVKGKSLSNDKPTEFCARTHLGLPA